MTVQAPPKRDPRVRRHTMETVRLARTMYADGEGWTPTEIARYLTDHGTSVSVMTVRTWVVPGEAEQQREANRRSYHRRKATMRARSRTPVLDRMRELQKAGLTMPAIAKLLALDYGLALSDGQVRYYLRIGREPELPKKKALIPGMAQSNESEETR